MLHIRSSLLGSVGWLVVLPLVACVDAPIEHPPDPVDDDTGTVDAGPEEDGGSGPVDQGPSSDGPPDVTPDGGPDAAPELADFLEACQEDANCRSGWCLPVGGGSVCTRSCSNDCPPGWGCVDRSGAPVCEPELADLCQRCGVDEECGDRNRCLELDGELRCGRYCDEQEPCPADYACQEEQCRPAAGRCPCEPVAEDCNGVDDDCDQETDEELNAPLANPQLGICKGAVMVCQGRSGWQLPDFSTIEGFEELELSCDGLDNDCDGKIDNELEPPPADAQLGVCAGAVKICQGPLGWVEPGVSQIPDFEAREATCDGLDNDCDGQTDEQLIPPLAEAQLGVCAGTVQVCSGGAGWLPPDLRRIPQFEAQERTCDGLDNDCDGQTDEQLVPGPATQQLGVCNGSRLACGGVRGWQEPDLTRIEGYEALEASCDGQDNDCDGQVDEELEPPLISVQFGVCAGVRQVCLGEAGWRDPDWPAIPRHEAVEVSCDGLDNDCDGEVDEELSPPLASKQDGVCAGWLADCGGVLGWVDPAPAAIPNFEAVETSCDGLDNDCDGLVDADDPELVAPLAARQAGVCAAARQRCGGPAGWQEPNYGEIKDFFDPERLCDGLDNDCDGEVDEACNQCPPGTIVPEGWVCVPPGSFSMGSPVEEAGRAPDEPPHRIYLSRPMLVQQTEVQQQDWQALLGNNPAAFRTGGNSGCPGESCANHPVESINWWEALQYANQLSLREQEQPCYLLTACVGEVGEGCPGPECVGYACGGVSFEAGCSGYRLPTEAEWEYLTRASSTTAHWTGAYLGADPVCGDEGELFNLAAWYCYNGDDQTHSVGSLRPNRWGVRDVMGNVQEWVWDWYGDYAAQELDPLGAMNGSERVVRGGSFAQHSGFARSAARHRLPPEVRNRWTGFRLVRSLPPAGPFITKLEPAGGPPVGGHPLQIWGRWFTSFEPIRVVFAGVPIEPDSLFVEPDRITILSVPAHELGFVEIRVEADGRPSAVATYEYQPPVVDGDLADWPPTWLDQGNGSVPDWGQGKNELQRLGALVVDGRLLIGIRGFFEYLNAIVGYVDVDPGSGRGIAPNMLTDNGQTGDLDDALSNVFTIGPNLTEAGSLPDFAFGSRQPALEANILLTEDELDGQLGWRQLRPDQPGNLAWIPGRLAVGPAGLEASISLATLYPDGVPAAGQIRIFVRLTNNNGVAYSQMTLPEQHPADPITAVYEVAWTR